MPDQPVRARIDGPTVPTGLRSLASGTLPLIGRHVGSDRTRLTIVTDAVATQGGDWRGCFSRRGISTTI